MDGGNGYTNGLPAFEAGIAVNGDIGAAGGGLAAGAGSYSIPVPMGGNMRLAGGRWHRAEMVYRAGSGMYLAQAMITVSRTYT